MTHSQSLNKVTITSHQVLMLYLTLTTQYHVFFNYRSLLGEHPLPVYINGCLYWQGYRLKKEDLDRLISSILNEVWSVFNNAVSSVSTFNDPLPVWRLMHICSLATYKALNILTRVKERGGKLCVRTDQWNYITWSIK